MIMRWPFQIRTPRMVLRRSDGVAYLTRWGIRTRLGSIYIHEFQGPDPGIDLHDHPWAFLSLILRGGYTELRHEGGIDGVIRARWSDVNDLGARGRGTPSHHYGIGRLNWMPMKMSHRITNIAPGTRTLVVCGPTRRSWGFYTPHGYVDHNEYKHEDRSLMVEYRADMSHSEKTELG